MAVTKKKTTKAPVKTPAKKAEVAAEPDYKAALYHLVKALRWQGAYQELVAETLAMVEE